MALVLGVPMASGWIFGDSVAYRRAHNAWLEERARRAEAERDTKARLAAAAERSRIAREMHDMIAHNLGGDRRARRRRGTPACPGQPARRSARSRTGREALSELRRLLGVLPDGEETAGLAPQPGIAELRTSWPGPGGRAAGVAHRRGAAAAA